MAPPDHMRALAVVAARVPWLLPAVGLAVFIHKHFLSHGAHNALQARMRARSRPPKLKRIASKAAHQPHQEQDAAVDADQEQLDAAGLGHDRLMEWFTEDEVEALHQAQANPAALMSLLCGNRFAAMQCEDDSEWGTDEGSDPDLNSRILKPLELLQDSADGSPTSATSSAQHKFDIEQQGEEAEQLQQLQSQLAQQLLLQIAKAQQQRSEQQQQRLLKAGSAPSAAEAATGAVRDAPTPAAAAAAPDTDTDLTDGDYYDDAADYFDPNHYFALSPAAAAAGGQMGQSPGKFLPRAGALWASSYPPRLGEGFGDDFGDDWEPELADWDFDGPDFVPDYDPGFEPAFDDDVLGFEVDELGFEGTELRAAAAVASCGN